MNGGILIFKKETKEVIEQIYHKLNIYRSPVELLNESEVEDLNALVLKYTEQVEKLHNTHTYLKDEGIEM
jgi:hypothetical protein